MEIVFKRQQIVVLTFARFAAGTNEAREVECKVGAKASRSKLILAGVLIDQRHIDFLLYGLISAGVGEVIASPSSYPAPNVARNDRTGQACCRDGWHLKVNFICHCFRKRRKISSNLSQLHGRCKTQECNVIPQVRCLELRVNEDSRHLEFLSGNRFCVCRSVPLAHPDFQCLTVRAVNGNSEITESRKTSKVLRILRKRADSMGCCENVEVVNERARSLVDIAGG